MEIKFKACLFVSELFYCYKFTAQGLRHNIGVATARWRCFACSCSWAPAPRFRCGLLFAFSLGEIIKFRTKYASKADCHNQYDNWSSVKRKNKKYIYETSQSKGCRFQGRVIKARRLCIEKRGICRKDNFFLCSHARRNTHFYIQHIPHPSRTHTHTHTHTLETITISYITSKPNEKKVENAVEKSASVCRAYLSREQSLSLHSFQSPPLQLGQPEWEAKLKSRWLQWNDFHEKLSVQLETSKPIQGLRQ